jgi:hypothetical protein
MRIAYLSGAGARRQAVSREIVATAPAPTHRRPLSRACARVPEGRRERSAVLKAGHAARAGTNTSGAGVW